jgi:tetratricopeptide (TPR) repeat protein
VAPLVDHAVEAHARGDVGEATALCLDILELVPGQARALKLLYQIRRPTAPRAAEALIRRVVALDPNDFWATNELTLLLLGKGASAEAEIHARNAVRIAPQNAQSHHLMGMVMTEINRPQIGEYHYRRALELAGRRDPILIANLAWNQKNQGKMAEARQLYEESAELDPTVLQTVLGWARLEEADRNFPAAARLLDRAEELSPGNASVLLARAVLHGRTGTYGRALAVLGSVAAQRPNGVLGPNELLEQGRLLDRMGRYDDAFAAILEGKRLVRELSGTAYLADQAASMAGRLKNFFAETRLRTLPRAALRETPPRPIFILGFPRSGTTLVEQTLSAHERIAAGDELPFINDITGMMPRMLNSPLGYPEALAELWMGDHRESLDNLRDYYLQRARQSVVMTPAARWFTDKMPLNEMHLGLIALLFPDAPLIHVIRHPLDAVLSVFFNQLTHGFYCAYALDSAARHYALVADLVAHYRSEMALRYLPVRYEDIVDEQRASVHRLFDFIGEEFDERCLNFHENRRYARTASYAQVTEKLYDRSRFRYRHYLKHLEPIVPILQPVIDRLGYKIEEPDRPR